MNWKVFEIELKYYEPYLFYIKDGYSLNICNLEHPSKCGGKSLWDKKNNNWIRVHDRIDYDKYSIPSWLVKPEDLYDCFKQNIISYYDQSYYKEEYKNYNMFLFWRKESDGYLSMGLGLLPGIGLNQNYDLQRHLESYHNLRAFK